MPSLPRRLSVGRVSANLFTSPHANPNLDPEAAIIESFQAARKSILFGIYSFTNPRIADALAAAATRGVILTGVADRQQAANVYSKVGWLASHENVTLHYWSGGGVMHDKAFVVDGGKRVGLGSYNWTLNAQKNNTEILLITKGRAGSAYAEAVTNSLMSAFLDGNPIFAK